MPVPRWAVSCWFLEEFIHVAKYSFSWSSPRAAKQSWLDHSEEEEEEEEEVVICVKQFLNAIISSYTVHRLLGCLNSTRKASCISWCMQELYKLDLGVSPTLVMSVWYFAQGIIMKTHFVLSWTPPPLLVSKDHQSHHTVAAVLVKVFVSPTPNWIPQFHSVNCMELILFHRYPASGEFLCLQKTQKNSSCQSALLHLNPMH
jgi:hypothetical protein